MTAIHEAIQGSSESKRRIKRALISVSDKNGIVELSKSLVSYGIEILSTGGTAKKLRESDIEVTDVSTRTKFPEILNGRVKTLHPVIHGGILAVRGNNVHEKELVDQDIQPIDLVIVNLYAFDKTVASDKSFEQCVENIDIGGPAMLRAAAKNFESVAIITNTDQYSDLIAEFESNGGPITTKELRKQFASDAFELTAQYDRSIANYFKKTTTKTVSRVFTEQIELKYGCNPNQKPAKIHSLNSGSLPFQVLNGKPGYINFLDALNAWQLVKELRTALNLPAAASFKHVSPAGAAVSVPLSEDEASSYEIKSTVDLSPLEIAFIRARQADPMSSFGDFIALSDKVDIRTAKRIKTEISDGIIAPDFEPEAYEILKAKKGGKFIVIKMDNNYSVKGEEYREVFGIGFSQKRNDCLINAENLSEIVTKNKELTNKGRRDLILGQIALKYTQSNSVGFVKNGQMIGVGAGQQSRIDCVKVSGKKARIWCLRQHPKVMNLKFKPGIKKQDRINARVRFIENDFSANELESFLGLFAEPISFLTDQEMNDYLEKHQEISLVSDAFFPFRDNIDVCHNMKFKVKFIAQAGGSIKDPSVIEACDEYDMVMAFTHQRLFHH